MFILTIGDDCPVPSFSLCARIPRTLILATAFIGWAASAPGAAPEASDASDDPVLATFDGYKITLRHLEEFTRELPSGQRVPLAPEAEKWRGVICRELGKNVLFTKKALEDGRHTDPRYLRGREYFIQEYFSYTMLRDEVLNKIDVSRANLETLYERRKQDYYSSPTATLRLIRLKNEEDATSVARRIAGGESFQAVEREVSEVSPRYKNRVLGPYPNAGDRTSIPPPPEVIEAALATPEGTTTGPISANNFWFVVRTENRVAGRQRTYDEVAEELEKRLRQGMGDHMTRELMTRLKTELGAVWNEQALEDKNTQPNDVVATVGAVRIPLLEFTDLQGRVRGPAITAANLEPSRLGHFLTPLILTEGARARGYNDRDEFKRASFYYDLQQLGGRMADYLGGVAVPEPTEGEMRQRYRQEAMHAHTRKGPRPSYEQMKEEIRHAIRQQGRPAVEERVIREALSAAGFSMVKDPVCTRLTALEVLAIAAKKLPPDARLIEMVGILGDDPDAVAPLRAETPVPPMPLPLSGAGRHRAWRISYATGTPQSASAAVETEGGSAEEASEEAGAVIKPDVRPQDVVGSIGISYGEIVIEEAGRLNDGSPEFTSNTLVSPWSQLLRFDTDGLARVAMDNGLGDFAARYGDKVRISTSVQFGYEDGMPGDCVIRFAAVPAHMGAKEDGIELRYDARSGEQTRRRVGEAPAPCPTCPLPDKPVL